MIVAEHWSDNFSDKKYHEKKIDFSDLFQKFIITYKGIIYIEMIGSTVLFPLQPTDIPPPSCTLEKKPENLKFFS